MEHATGGFGFYGSDPSFTNMAGMYSFGGMNSNAPSMGAPFNPRSQYFYDTSTAHPGTLGYQEPIYTAQSYGAQDSFMHSFLGKPRAIGTSPFETAAARHEYKSLSTASMGFDAGGMVSSAGLGTAAYMAGMNPVGATLGAAALAVPMAFDKMKETYMGNYRDTQTVNSLTGNIIGGDGQFGLSGRQNANIAKSIQRQAASDPMLESDDIMNILKGGKEAGLLNSMGSGADPSQAFKKLTDKLKMFGDLIDSSDFKKLTQEVARFQKLGMSLDSSISFSASNQMAAKFAGVSEKAANEHINAGVMIGSQSGIDGRLSAMDSQNALYAKGSIQQSGYGGKALLQDSVYMAAANNADIKVRTQAEALTGVSDQHKLLYAKYRQDKEGIDIQTSLDKLNKMGSQEQLSTIASYDDSYSYTSALDDKNVMGFEMAGIDVTKYDTGSNFKTLMEEAIQINRGNTDANSLANIMLDGTNASAEERSYIAAKVNMVLDNGYESLDKSKNKADEMLRKKEEAVRLQDAQRKDSLYSKFKTTKDEFSQSIGEFMGGYDSAGETQDLYRNLTGNTGGTGPSFNYDRTMSRSRKERVMDEIMMGTSDDLRKDPKTKTKWKQDSEVTVANMSTPGAGFFDTALTMTSNAGSLGFNDYLGLMGGTDKGSGLIGGAANLGKYAVAGALTASNAPVSLMREGLSSLGLTSDADDRRTANLASLDYARKAHTMKNVGDGSDLQKYNAGESAKLVSDKYKGMSIGAVEEVSNLLANGSQEDFDTFMKNYKEQNRDSSRLDAEGNRQNFNEKELKDIWKNKKDLTFNLTEKQFTPEMAEIAKKGRESEFNKDFSKLMSIYADEDLSEDEKAAMTQTVIRPGDMKRAKTMLTRHGSDSDVRIMGIATGEEGQEYKKEDFKDVKEEVKQAGLDVANAFAGANIKKKKDRDQVMEAFKDGGVSKGLEAASSLGITGEASIKLKSALEKLGKASDGDEDEIASGYEYGKFEKAETDKNIRKRVARRLGISTDDFSGAHKAAKGGRDEYDTFRYTEGNEKFENIDFEQFVGSVNKASIFSSEDTKRSDDIMKGTGGKTNEIMAQSLNVQEKMLESIKEVDKSIQKI